MTARLVIAGTHSGVGKTTIVVGLIAALRARGLSVQPFKVGPDYIDPSHHTLAAGRPCRNLDTWMVPPNRVLASFCRATRGADVAIIEGVMGLYDGLGYEAEAGSTAEVAKLLEAPVVLVLDASKMARSAGAIALGYQSYDAGVDLCGYVANRVGSEGHGLGVATSITRATGLPVLGRLPREPRLAIPERHLGLIPAVEPGRWAEVVDQARESIERHLDVDRILALAASTALSTGDDEAEEGEPVPVPDRPVIAVARDEAFQFTYPENLELLEAAGARIAFFSPLADHGLPEGTDGLILSGGFPELHARALARNHTMREAIRNAHARRMPIYAECGGLMYLTGSIVDQESDSHPMVGLLPGHSAMTGRLTLGYREARADRDTWLLRAGESIRGHEFHYSTWVDRPADLPAALRVATRDDEAPYRPEGASLGNLWASYIHLHFEGRPELASRFVDACVRSRGGTPAALVGPGGPRR